DMERAKKVVEIVSVQNLYNLSNRQSEGVVRYCETHGLGFIPWFPIARGQLARPGGRLAALAKRKEATAAQIALAWLLQRSRVMLPIPGTSSVAHLKENVAAASLELSDEELAELERMGKWLGYVRQGAKWCRSILRSIAGRG